MRAVWILALKDLRLLVRDRVGFVFTFFFPLVYAVFFGVLFSGMNSGPSEITVLVVNEDRTPASEEFVASLEHTEMLKVEPAESRAAAAELVRKGKRPAYVLIPEGFGAASRRLFHGDPMRLEIGVDPAKSMTTGMLQGLVTAAAFERMQDLFAGGEAMRDSARQSLADVRDATDMDPLQKKLLETLLTSVERLPEVFAPAGTNADATGGDKGWQPISIEMTEVTNSTSEKPRFPTNSFAICFPQGIVWGIMACAAAFAITLVVERTRGTLPRLTAAPLQLGQILAGKALACFLTTTGLAFVLLLVARLVFNVHPTSVALLVVAVVSVSIAIVGLMMVLSVLGKTEQAVGGIGWGILVVMAMFGGGMIPLMFMPAWMEPISHASVVKWAILAMEGAIWRDFSAAEMALPCGVLLAIGVVGFTTGATVFRCGEQR